MLRQNNGHTAFNTCREIMCCKTDNAFVCKQRFGAVCCPLAASSVKTVIINCKHFNFPKHKIQFNGRKSNNNNNNNSTHIQRIYRLYLKYIIFKEYSIYPFVSVNY